MAMTIWNKGGAGERPRAARQSLEEIEFSLQS
jgi:hypothetical protein